MPEHDLARAADRRLTLGAAPDAVPPAHEHELSAFVLELGRMLSLAGTAVSETQERLLRVAAANGEAGARVIVLPTALIMAFGRARSARIEPIPQTAGTLRLDQISALYEVVDAAEHGAVRPAAGRERLAAIAAMPPRRGALVTVLAHAVMTVALCLILQPTPSDVAIAFALGLLVGALVLVARDRPGIAPLVPVVAATVISALTFEAVSHGVADAGLRTLIAPLVTFLPGGVLTTATVELASREMVAGTSRLVFGTVQLLLLAFGIVAGAELAGLPSASALADESQNLLGFFGALAMTPVALALAELRGGPPSQVTFLPAFWLLVPGALGLIGVTEVVGDVAAAGLDELVQPVGSIVSIALGVLCGVLVHRAVREPRRLLSR